MTSRRRRSRTTFTSVVVALALVAGAAALHATGLLGPGSDAAPAATAPVATAPAVTPPAATGAAAGGSSTASAGPAPVTTDAPTTTTGPGASASSRASSPTDGRTAAAAAAAAAHAGAQLAALPVKGKAPATGYDREGDFGTAWLDVDHNGCDTRNDVLARDLTAITRRGPCTVTTGTLVSPYTGATIDFVRGNRTSTLVQIDHVVALENAWRTGAQQLSRAEREALANDPENLFAVDGHSNAQKRSGDAATWLPAAKAFRCTYVERQIAVKSTYRLWVVPAERDAMARVLATC